MRIILSIVLLSFIYGCSYTDTQKADYAQLQAKLEQMGTDDVYSGNWLIADDSEILLTTSSGVADLHTNQAINVHTRFNVASINKMFTAAMILRMRDQGLLELDKTVGEYLTEYPNQAVAERVTIRQLLTHTSGMGDMFTPSFEEADPNTIRSLEDYLDKFVDDPLFFEPGEHFGYSNAGYIVLGLIIQQVSQQDYYDLVTENLFIPLGMNDTGWYHGDNNYDTVAKAYYEKDDTDQWVENPYLIMKGSSAGGAYSTVHDLLLFSRSLVAGKVVAPATFAEMQQDHFGHGYGYGLSIRDLNGNKVIGHNGGFPGVAGEVDIFIEQGLYAISLSNRSPRNGWATARSLVRNTIVGATDESNGILNANNLLKLYESEGFDIALQQVKSTTDTFSVDQLIEISERFNKAGEAQKAIDILTLCSEIAPDNWFVVSVKADLQFASGDTPSAIANWRKSLELNPDNQWAKDRIAEQEAY